MKGYSCTTSPKTRLAWYILGTGKFKSVELNSLRSLISQGMDVGFKCVSSFNSFKQPLSLSYCSGCIDICSIHGIRILAFVQTKSLYSDPDYGGCSLQTNVCSNIEDKKTKTKTKLPICRPTRPVY